MTRDPIGLALSLMNRVAGQPCALLAPYSVAQAITRWGNGEQQSRYLPAFCEESSARRAI